MKRLSFKQSEEQMMEDCIFCKLANGIIPTNSIYEDDDFNVILDASPASKGHALIIPKKHYKDILEAEESCLTKVMPLAKIIAGKQKEVYKCDGVNIVQNNGEEAGQTVFHLHIHVIPRYKGKRPILTWNHETFTDDEFSKIRDDMTIKSIID